MATASSRVEAFCPLCGTSILCIGRGGRVQAGDLHAVPLYRTGRPGEGLMLCDGCALLAGLPSDITFN